tara:strand:+ start:1076 stop:1825 length:750 start_codon:yes stop_codon:yes gene_type:complete
VISDEQLIFYVAIPGSGWAKLSLLLGCCAKLNLNKSDRRGDREETGKQGDTGCVHHKGAFWDPGMEFGDGFDDLEKNHTKESFKAECLRPFTEINDQNYLIRSHFFAETKNLNWLKKNFPNNKIILVLRDTKLCWEGWNTAMNFTGRYPSYKAWMKYTFIRDHPENYDKMWSLMQRHDKMIREWVRDNDCLIIQPNKTFLDLLDYRWDDEGKEEYDKLIMVHQFFKSEVPMFDAPFVFHNCNDIFTIQS